MNLDKARQISGWMSDMELRYLATIAQYSNIILEAGSYQGRSCRAMADNTRASIYAIDPWKPMPIAQEAVTDTMTYTRFAANLADHIKTGKVIPVAKKFTDFEYNPNLLLRPDFIFIDALHDYANCKADILHALKIIGDGHCVLAGHDYSPSWPGVIEAVNEIFAPRPISVVDTIWRIDL